LQVSKNITEHFLTYSIAIQISVTS